MHLDIQDSNYATFGPFTVIL